MVDRYLYVFGVDEKKVLYVMHHILDQSKQAIFTQISVFKVLRNCFLNIFMQILSIFRFFFKLVSEYSNTKYRLFKKTTNKFFYCKFKFFIFSSYSDGTDFCPFSEKKSDALVGRL
jgi:hypothetical protein